MWGPLFDWDCAFLEGLNWTGMSQAGLNCIAVQL